MTDHDPLKDAFGQRRDAAEHVDIESGLAGVHRRNSLGARAARAGGAVAAVAAVVIGLAWFLDDDGGEPVVSTPGTTEVPPTVTTPPDTTPTETTEPAPPAGGLPSIIVTDNSERIVVDGVVFNPGVGGPITDAVEDLGGGLVFETPDALWHWPATTSQPVVLVSKLPNGNLDLIDITGDGPGAATNVVYTDLPAAETPIQALYRLQIDAGQPVDPVLVMQVGGVEFGVTNGGLGGTSDDGNVLVALVGSDGPCSELLIVDLGGGTDQRRERTCIAEGGGDASIEDLIRATDLTHDGQPFVLDGTSLTQPDGRTLDLPGSGPTATVDVWEPWVLVLTTAEGGGQVSLVEIIEGTVEPVADVPVDITSARLARSPIELAPETVEPDVPTGEPFDVTPGDYLVVEVEADDQLNVRTGPGVQFPVVGGVPVGGIVTATGNAWRLPDGAEWYELAWPEGQIVWANAQFLDPRGVDGQGSTFAELSCLAQGDPPMSVGTTGERGTPDADHLAGVTIEVETGCVRTVVFFGTGFDFENPGGPATHLPAGVVVQPSDDERSLVLEVPSEIDEVALGSAVDAGPALVVRDANFHPYVEVLSGPRATWAATFLSNPARAVIDYVPAEPVPDVPFFPPFEEAGIIIRSIDGATIEGGDLSTAQYRPPITVTGFARPFEANVGLSVVDGQGNPVDEVAWNGGPLGPQTGSQYNTMATDFLSAWGHFSFTIESIPSGQYDLLLSGDGGSDNPQSLVIPLTIEP